MKKFYGNYLGLCINNNDPQKRGRVQVFIPHIMPTLYEDWNEAGEDIKALCVGTNIQDSLPSSIVDKLMKILPWAESASPILGVSSPGKLDTTVAGDGTTSSGRFNQTPVASGGVGGNTAANANEQTLFNNAAGYGPVESSAFSRSGSSDGDCGRGTRQIIGALTNNSYFSKGIGGTGSYGGIDSLNAGSLSTGNPYLQNSKYYNTATSIPSNYVPQIGDVISGTTAGGAGHVQVYIGNGKWVSDHTQSSYYSSYGNLKLHRMNSEGLAAVEAASPGLYSSATSNESSTTSNNESSNTSGTVAAPTPHQDDKGVETDDSKNNYGSVARPEVTAGNASSGSILVDSNNQVNATQLKSEILKQIQSNPSSIYNNGKIPTNGSTYGLTGTAESWAEFYTQLAGHESTYYNVAFKNDINGVVEPGGSGGLFQLGRDQIEIWANKYPELAESYGFKKGTDYSEQDYLNPNFNTKGMLFIGEALLSENYAVGPGQGLGRTIGSLSWNKIANGTSPGSGATNATIAAGQSSLVNNTDKHGTMAVVNMNNMAKGVFAYPAAGALLWTFFQEGDPNFPVYFAASYGEKEWASAFRLGSDGEGYKLGQTDDNTATSIGARINLGTGGLFSTDTTVPDDPTKDQKSLTLFGYDGSNIHFNEGYHQIFSKFDRRDSVEGDRWETTLGFKEEWVQGDSNEVVMGDVFIKIGNVSPPAVDAVTRIQEIIKEAMKPLTESTLCSQSSTSTEGTSDYTKNAANTSKIKDTTISKTPTETVSDYNSRTNNITKVTVGNTGDTTTTTSTTTQNNSNTSTAANPAAPSTSSGFVQGTNSGSSFTVVPNSGFSL